MSKLSLQVVLALLCC